MTTTGRGSSVVWVARRARNAGRRRPRLARRTGAGARRSPRHHGHGCRSPWTSCPTAEAAASSRSSRPTEGRNDSAGPWWSPTRRPVAGSPCASASRVSPEPRNVRGGAGRTGLLVVDSESTAGDSRRSGSRGGSGRRCVPAARTGSRRRASCSPVIRCVMCRESNWRGTGRALRRRVGPRRFHRLEREPSPGSRPRRPTGRWQAGGDRQEPDLLRSRLRPGRDAVDRGVAGRPGHSAATADGRPAQARRWSPGPLEPLPAGFSTEHVTSGLATHPAVFVSTAGGLGVQLGHNP